MPAHEVDAQLDERMRARLFVHTYGSENQYERFMAGLLPESELTALARRILFSPFDDFKRWHKIDTKEFRHDRHCVAGTVTFSTHEPTELDANEWAALKKIRGTAEGANRGSLHGLGVHAEISLVEHVGRCSMCQAEVFGRSANVRIEWAGRPLSREYTLEAR